MSRLTEHCERTAGGCGSSDENDAQPPIKTLSPEPCRAKSARAPTDRDCGKSCRGSTFSFSNHRSVSPDLRDPATPAILPFPPRARYACALPPQGLRVGFGTRYIRFV